jgi:hypothetical protein
MEKKDIVVGRKYIVNNSFPFKNVSAIPKVVEIISLYSHDTFFPGCVTIINTRGERDFLGPSWLVCEFTPLMQELL